jgi:hypothetical protein
MFNIILAIIIILAGLTTILVLELFKYKVNQLIKEMEKTTDLYKKRNDFYNKYWKIISAPQNKGYTENDINNKKS